jgi:hypothetical protein
LPGDQPAKLPPACCHLDRKRAPRDFDVIERRVKQRRGDGPTGALRLSKSSRCVPCCFPWLLTSELAKSLSDVKGLSRLPLSIREGIESAKGSTEKAIIKARQLASEIFFCNSALLMAFTPPGEYSAWDILKYTSAANTETKAIIGMTIEEKNKLHSWLMKLLNNKIHSEPSSAKITSLNKTPYSISSLRGMISSYFLDDENTEEKLSESWTEKPHRQKAKHIYEKVDGTAAVTKKVAIYVLGNYYKSNDPIQWKKFFHQDFYFVNVFGLMKHCDHNVNLLRDLKNSSWANLGFFPWGKAEGSSKVPPKDEDLKSFLAVTSRFDWGQTEMYFN